LVSAGQIVARKTWPSGCEARWVVNWLNMSVKLDRRHKLGNG
jgi:hypothetical protein